jgi:hypothetical protein
MMRWWYSSASRRLILMAFVYFSFAPGLHKQHARTWHHEIEQCVTSWIRCGAVDYMNAG